MEWAITLPGHMAMVPAARQFTRSMLEDSPRVNDAETVASELAGNALRHTPSGEGGSFTLRVTTKPGWACIEVIDQGTGSWERALALPEEEEEFGRGLAIVTALSDGMGHQVDPAGQIAWAELTWPVEEGGP